MFYICLIVTLIHTVDESVGEIWNVLHTSKVAYFTFQLIVVYLSWMATMAGISQPFIVVRLLDVIVTHLVLRAPGRITAPLLLVDAGLVAYYI